MPLFAPTSKLFVFDAGEPAKGCNVPFGRSPEEAENQNHNVHSRVDFWVGGRIIVVKFFSSCREEGGQLGRDAFCIRRHNLR